MFPRIAFILGWLQRLGASQANLLIENLALRQQLAILTTKRPRPRMRAADRFFWVTLRRFWPRWKEVLVIIRPDTVVRWHREGFRKYWTWKSRRREPDLGAPRVHAELLMLGFDVSGRTVPRMMPGRPADPEERQRWRNFLRNHREVLAAMDLFTVPTATFRVLHVFFVIHHARRTVLHVRVTEHPTGAWIIQQLREAFPFDSAPRYLIFDNDKKYGADVLAVIVLNERHLHRLLSEFLAYYHDDRTHLGVGKGTPSMRTATSNPHRDAAIVGHPRIGGLHHRYEWRQAA